MASSSLERVRQALAENGIESPIVEFDASARSAAEAAAAIGCPVAEIAKSLVFRAPASDRAVLVVASGASRVDESRVGAALGEPIGRADAAFVRDKTGFAIGGVAPVGHIGAPVVFIDSRLLAFAGVWVAAGKPNAVVRLTPADLTRVTSGRVIEVV